MILSFQRTRIFSYNSPGSAILPLPECKYTSSEMIREVQNVMLGKYPPKMGFPASFGYYPRLLKYLLVISLC